MNRREFVTRTGALSIAASVLPAQNAAKAATSAAPYEQTLPDMLTSYFATALNRLAAEWDQKRSQIKTAAELDARNRFVRQKVVEMIGGFPERNPLEAKILGVLERPGYRIENVMFQSRPNFWVTGNLYVPTSGAGRFPAIISPCGHYPLARMIPQYQFAYLSLVKNGFVVLAYDPIGQGERRQYWNPETDITEVGGPTDEHSMPGQLLFLLGESLTQYRMWDGMRAIDYLLTRAEVDPERIGCAGHSGGGTLTMFISAVDERVKCAVIHEGGTQNRWPMRIAPNSPLGPSDVEQNIFPSAIYGIDHTDLQIAIAPRPLMATIEHYSAGFNAAVEQIRSRYRQLGVAEKFSAVASDDPHAWTFKLRLATADWFSRWFYGRPGPNSEPELTWERPEDLYCTPDGSVRYSQQGDTIWSTILKKQAKLPPKAQEPESTAEVASYRENLCTQIRELLRYRKHGEPLGPRHIVDVPRKGFKIEKLEFLSEPGIYISVWVFVPENRRSGSAPILYFNEAGIAQDGMEFDGSEASGVKLGPLAQLARGGRLVIAADVRGVGETRPPHGPSSSGREFHHLFDTETALSYLAWYMDQSLFGMRVQDVIRTVDYALSRPDADSQGVQVIGKDMAALLALYAAALDPRILAVVCHQGLLSYRSLTSSDRYLQGAHIFIPQVLNHFDLPHVASAVAGRRVTLLSPVDAMKRPVDVVAAQESYRWTKSVYSRAGAPDRFQIAAYNPDRDLSAQYLHSLGV